MTIWLAPDLLRPWLFPALDSADLCRFLSASRKLREELASLTSFSVAFPREILLEEEMIKSLAQTLRGMLRLTHLSVGLAYQSFSTVFLAESLSKRKLLELKLDIRHCNLGDQGIRIWTEVLATLPCLVFLDLRLSFNRVSRRGAQDLAEAFQSNSCFENVALAVDINPIGDGAVLLLQSFRNVRQLHLDIAHCNCNVSDGEKLAKEMESLKLEFLELDVRGNSLAESKALILKATASLNAAGYKCLSRID